MYLLQSLLLLRNTDLKPYVILVYPQNMEKLRQIQQKLGQTRITVNMWICL